MSRFFILFLFCILCPGLTAVAQNNCEQNSKQAEEFYNSGDFENCISLLEKSIKECNFSSKKKEDALELLVKSYLEQDNITQAEVNVHNLLNNNPHYELKETDSHEDFDLLVKKFDVHPLFTIGISNAIFHPQFKITKTYFILENADYNVPYETANTVLLYYPWVEYEFIKNLSVKIDAVSFDMHYDRTILRGTDLKTTYRENLSFVEVPANLKKQFPVSKNIIPYVSLGMGYLRMYDATGNISISYTNENAFTGDKTTYSSIEDTDVLKMRNKNNYEWLAGAGVGFKFKNLGIFIDTKYCGGLNSLTNAANRFGNSNFTNNYFYIDNSVKLNKYEVGISISYTLKNLIKKAR